MAAAPLVTPAILLRATPYGEADRVVTLLSLTTGRVSALARGARKSVRRFGGGLGLGATGEASLRDRPSADLMVLESFEVTEPRFGLASDLGRTAHAAYAAELCEKLCGQRQPEPEVFHWLDEFLRLLEARTARAERLRVFELGLLQRLGLGPSWAMCVSCGRADLGDETVRFQAARGGVLCRACGRQGLILSASARLALLRLSETPLAEAEAETLERGLNVACREAIFELFAGHLPGKLKSVEFITKVGGV